MISGPHKRYAHALYRLVTGLKMVFRIFAGEEAYSTRQCDEREECVFGTYQLLRDQGLVEKENRYQSPQEDQNPETKQCKHNRKRAKMKKKIKKKKSGRW